MAGKKKGKKGRKAQAGDSESSASPTAAAVVEEGAGDNLPADGKNGWKAQPGDSKPSTSASSAAVVVEEVGNNLLPDVGATAAEAAAGGGNECLRHPTAAVPFASVSSGNSATGAESGNSPLLNFPPVSTEILSKSAPTASCKDAAAIPSFVFSAGQNSSQGPTAPLFSAPATTDLTITGSASSSPRSIRHSIRRRDVKCPPSERFGKLGNKWRNQNNFHLAAQAVAFGQGRDPLSLVVSYEESGLRRIVKAPDGCTSDTIVDTTLRQAVAGTALDSAGWQEALNQPREDAYFTYSTVPEGLSISKFRERKGKILVTPLSADSGLLKLKEDSEKKRKAAEQALENVREYLQRLKSEGKKECSTEKSSDCAHCRTARTQLEDLLRLVDPKATLKDGAPLSELG